MLVDHFLDRDRAGHGGALAQERRRRAEGEAGDMPQRREQRRPHAALDNESVESGKVAFLLLGHAADHRRGGGAAEHRELSLIDAGGAVLAGVVDADPARDRLLARGIAGQAVLSLAHAGRRRSARERSAKRQKMTSATEASRFHPASDTPNSAHCGPPHPPGPWALRPGAKSRA